MGFLAFCLLLTPLILGVWLILKGIAASSLLLVALGLLSADLLFGAVAFLFSDAILSRLMRVLTIVLVLIVCNALTYYLTTIWGGDTLEEMRMEEALNIVCSGGAVPEAADFHPDANTHKLFIIDKDANTYDPYFEKIKGDWRPNSADTTDLVACVEERLIKIKICCCYGSVTGRKVELFATELKVDIREAKTGKSLASRTLNSADNCPGEIWCQGSSCPERKTNEVPFSEFQNMISGLTSSVKQ